MDHFFGFCFGEEKHIMCGMVRIRDTAMWENVRRYVPTTGYRNMSSCRSPPAHTFSALEHVRAVRAVVAPTKHAKKKQKKNISVDLPPG